MVVTAAAEARRRRYGGRPLLLAFVVLAGGGMKGARANNGRQQQQPGNPYYHPPPPPPPPRGGPPPPPHHQLQDHAWGGMPSMDGPHYRGGPLPSRQQQQQPQEPPPQQEGFWSRLTNKIFAGSDEGPDSYAWGEPQQQHHQQQQQQQHPPPFPPRGYPERGPLPPPPPPPPPPQAALPSSQQFRYSPQETPFGDTLRPPWQPPSSSSFSSSQGEEQGGLWGKISSKIISTTQSLLENKSGDQPQQQHQQQHNPSPSYSYPGGRRPYPPYPSAPGDSAGPGGAGPPYGHPMNRQQQQHQEERGMPQYHQHQQDGPLRGVGGMDSQQPLPSSAASPPPLSSFPPPPPPSPPTTTITKDHQQEESIAAAAGDKEEDVLPDIFTVGDNIVLVRDPKGLREKISNFQRAGPQNIEVLAAFEGALKSFRTPDGQRKTETTEGLVHHAALMPHTRATLRALQEKFDRDLLTASTEEERYTNREALKQQVQSLVAREGQVYLPSLPLAVQDFLGSVPLRAKLEQMLKPLAFQGVPLTIFCAGYGDVAAQVLALSTPGLTGPEGFLPPNIRLVSNFLRAGPDGVAHGFTLPLVHDLNQNMTTAQQFRSGMMRGMGGGMRQPSNYLVLGGRVSDVGMAEGMHGGREGGREGGRQQVISLGFCETGKDFVVELPKFLEAYDVVVLGDGGMQYANHLIEQVVGTS
ncbi:5-nucleotidase [Nannochloropsis oceanica]